MEFGAAQSNKESVEIHNLEKQVVLIEECFTENDAEISNTRIKPEQNDEGIIVYTRRHFQRSKEERKAYTRADYRRASRTARKMKKFEGVKSKVIDAYVLPMDRCLEDLKGRYLTFVPAGYHYIQDHTMVVRNDHCMIRRNVTMVIQDKTTLEIVLVVKFIPFDKMTMEETKEYSKVASILMKARKGASHVTCNGPLETGNMYAVGWRKGRDSGFSRYFPDESIQDKTCSLHKWEKEQVLIGEVSMIYGKHFCNLAPSLFENAKKELQNADVPSVAQLEFDNENIEEDAFSSNLTFTVGDFSNSFHKDNDFNSYSFGMWLPTSFETGDLITKEKGFQCAGGQFLLGSYKVSVDFNSCDGIVEMIWRSNKDFHSTTSSTTSSNHTRLGSSVQVSNALVQKMEKLNLERLNGKDINKKIRGVKEIMRLKLKKAKYIVGKKK